MFLKIIKNELKSSYIEFLILYGLIILFGLFSGLLNVWYNSINNDYLSLSNILLEFINGISVLLPIICVILIIRNVLVSFNKIYSKEGYLTLTLPVSRSNLFIGKILANLIFIIGSYLAIIINVSIIYLIYKPIYIMTIFGNFSSYYYNFSIILLRLINIIFLSIVIMCGLCFILSILNIGKIRKHKILIGLILSSLLIIVLVILKNEIIIIPYLIAYQKNKINLFSIKEYSYGALQNLDIIFFNDIFYYIVLSILLFISSYLISKKYVEIEYKEINEMFRKLLKNEFKSSFFDFMIIYAVIIFTGLISGIIIRFDINSKHNLYVYVILLYILVFFAAIILILKNIIMSFYKKMFDKQGYLTFTLPVSTNQIILSKLIVNFLWVIFSFLVLTLSGIIVFLISSEQSIEILKTVFNEVYLQLEKFGLLRADLIILYSIVGLVGIIIGLEYLLVILSLLNIGKFKKHKFIKGILIFIVFNFVINIISSIILIIFPYFIGIELKEQGLVGKLQIYSLSNILNSEVAIIPIVFLGQIILMIIELVAFYLISKVLIEKKLELE